MNGRGFGCLQKGAKVEDIAAVRAGLLYLEHSNQFNANNTILVTHELDSRVYAHFVNPEDWKERQGQDFCIWDYELTSGGIELFTVQAQKEGVK